MSEAIKATFLNRRADIYIFHYHLRCNIDGSVIMQKLEQIVERFWRISFLVKLELALKIEEFE